jgi:hypothetical protein
VKVFQIFDHAHAPIAPYLGYMQRVRDLAESYTLIAPANFMGPRAHWVPFAEVWGALPEALRAHQAGPRMEFDAMRAYWLSRHFDGVYVDLDVELRAPLEIKAYPQFEGPGVLLGNGDPVLGLSCWESYLRLCPAFCRPASLMFADCRAARNLDAEDKKRFIHHHARGAYFHSAVPD